MNGLSVHRSWIGKEPLQQNSRQDLSLLKKWIGIRRSMLWGNILQEDRELRCVSS